MNGSEAPAQPAGRAIILGASNVARGISVVVETARRICGRPLELLVAHGHGRSYGTSSRVLARTLPGILESGLWTALEERPPVATTALLTDIGNDLLFEQPVERVADWIDQALARLAHRGATLAITRLPIGNLEWLSERRFRLMRKLFFPSCRLTLETLGERASELDERLVELAAKHGAAIVAQRSAWYGFDPIHITFRSMPTAWREILAHWKPQQSAVPTARMSPGRALYLRSVFPERRTLFGFEQRARQPSGRLLDGSTLSVY